MSAAVVGIPGLIGAYHPAWVSAGAIHVYQTGWVVCFAVASILYYASCRVLPRQAPKGGNLDGTPLSFEQLAETEGYFDGEQVLEYRLSRLEGSIGDGKSAVEEMKVISKSDV